MDHKIACFCFLVLATVSALGQQCPKSDEVADGYWSEVRTLEGNLIFHDGIRQWIELRLDHAQCGKSSIEIFPWNSPRLQALRGCRVKSTGGFGGAVSGYYTLPINQTPETIEPVGKCELKAPFPDYSGATPDKSIRAYRVEMHINIGLRDFPISVRASSSGKELRPWQAYASYFLTGGWVLYGSCAEGFIVNRVYGDQRAAPQHLESLGTPDDKATFGPPWKPIVTGEKDMRLGYTCVREK
jgi:hypothetical protein